jgi:hypothetical protein
MLLQLAVVGEAELMMGGGRGWGISGRIRRCSSKSPS